MKLHQRLALIAGALAVGALAGGIVPANVDTGALADDIDHERDHISAPALAERIVAGDDLLLYDLRGAAGFAELHIPGAMNTTLHRLLESSPPRNRTIVLYSEGGSHAAQAWVLLRARGHAEVLFLREGMYEWVARVLEPRLAADATPAESLAFRHVAELSRFLGGVPRAGVPRSEVPTGYWTDENDHAHVTDDVVRNVRRRGC